MRRSENVKLDETLKPGRYPDLHIVPDSGDMPLAFFALESLACPDERTGDKVCRNPISPGGMG